ncbi:GNAT family N-acetyltransferase [Acinetobacter gerneri]|uniref:GNAT family N-acetyltransferase n=1 Tax=Acinetobacter gerneri TaxID=202952 RepID=A0AAW8JL54_9GAMM|nr:GNAT family N-acetyltransferase [Acinetobacter gerneri]MDQ9008890.1 GNAT family N-acetyltransferase [Acinetobacter gerneri]MDQ9012994.1 GNAT family N-acetyltransferase [Acinetobacter gerneri]MDQ9024368.1 GNAT family N-acetyltransferase [Acinetobacter gerneri]MDQ9051666.1 GNAT family N-acetyltransferase [Acinetobacter gerneri]MDQ9059064.1 GNAT family N-acetyltransferase [Acinetobacter gerneri]
MMQDFFIREATLEDISDITAIIEPYTHQFVIAHEGYSHFTTEAIKKVLQKEGIRYFVAVKDGLVIGVIAYLLPAHLVHFFVKKSNQGKGVGRKLWHFVENLALQQNIAEFTVNSNCEAQDVYEHLGFSQTGPVADRAGLRFVPMKKIY